MATETRTPNGTGEDGFTLIEVLVAMLILAFGLLGLEALGIGAARSVAMADRQSEFATIAATALEDALEELRSGVVPEQFCEDIAFGAQLSRRVSLANANQPEVIVQVIPDANDSVSLTETFEVRSSYFSPTAFPGSANGAPCT